MITPGTTSSHISAFQDILPTICQIAGITIPSGIDGIGFLPTLLGQEQEQQHEFLYWEFPSYGGQQAVRKGKWKAIRKDIFEGNLAIQLFDLGQDIREQNDLASQYPEIVAEMEQIMKDEHVPSAIERFQFPQLGD
jgi:arylsulfatase